MLNKTIFILLIGFCIPVHAQKVLFKEWEASGISTLKINTDDVYIINIHTVKTDKIKVETSVEGETYENVVLEVFREKEVLVLKTGFSPFFKPENDKLAANKALSIEMNITLPEEMSIDITSQLASVIASGNYKNFYSGLGNGTCLLKNFKGNAIVNTKQGFITVYAQNNVRGSAFSKHGEVINQLPSSGKYSIKAESISGKITLLQTK